MIILKRAKNKQTYFVITAKNGNVLATSETYTRKGNAIKGARSLKKQIAADLSVKAKKEMIIDQTRKS